MLCVAATVDFAQFYLFSWHNVDKDHSNELFHTLGSCLRRKINQSYKREFWKFFQLILKSI